MCCLCFSWGVKFKSRTFRVAGVFDTLSTSSKRSKLNNCRQVWPLEKWKFLSYSHVKLFVFSSYFSPLSLHHHCSVGVNRASLPLHPIRGDGAQRRVHQPQTPQEKKKWRKRGREGKRSRSQSFNPDTEEGGEDEGKKSAHRGASLSFCRHLLQTSAAR